MVVVVVAAAATRARAGANGKRREGLGGLGVRTTDGDDGRSGRRRARGDSGCRERRGRGGGRGPGHLSAERRGPREQVLGEPGHCVPVGFGAGLAGQALQEGRFARSWRPGGHAMGAGGGCWLHGSPLPPPARATRDNKGRHPARHAPAVCLGALERG